MWLSNRFSPSKAGNDRNRLDEFRKQRGRGTHLCGHIA
jgi:hypothetical protein